MTTPEPCTRVGQTWEAIDAPGCNYRALITITDANDGDRIAGVYKQQYRSASGWWRDCIGGGAPRRTRIKPGRLHERYRLLFDSDFDGDRNIVASGCGQR